MGAVQDQGTLLEDSGAPISHLNCKCRKCKGGQDQNKAYYWGGQV